MGIFWRSGLECGPNYWADLLHWGEEETPCDERLLHGGETFHIETGDTNTQSIGWWTLEKLRHHQRRCPVGKTDAYGEVPEGVREHGSELNWVRAKYAGGDIPAILFSDARPMFSAEVGIELMEGVPWVYCVPELV